MNAVAKTEESAIWRHKVSAAEYLRMAASGAFAPEARLELIDGEIIEMAPMGSPRASTISRLDRLLQRRCGDEAIVRTQCPLLAGDLSVPEPDLALLKPRDDFYSEHHPSASDALLLVEVADSTLAFDLGEKAALYARAGVAELWVVDVNERSIRVFRDASPSGWRSSFTASGEDRIAALALPAVEMAAREAFATG